MAPRTSAEMIEALRLIIKEGKSAAEASRITGITKQAISMNQKYRDHIAQQRRKQNA